MLFTPEPRNSSRSKTQTAVVPNNPEMFKIKSSWDILIVITAIAIDTFNNNSNNIVENNINIYTSSNVQILIRQ